MREIGSGADHCPYDWLAVYDGRDENAPLIGKFCGVGKFPFSIIGKHFYSCYRMNEMFIQYYASFTLLISYFEFVVVTL